MNAAPGVTGVKHGELVRKLAEEIIWREPGEQVPTVAELARKFDVGHGTVQRALRTLEGMGAVRLEARGHLGTYILEKDMRRLWEAAGTAVLLGGLPLPVKARVRTLAELLQGELRRAGVRVELVYMEGSRARLGQLRMRRLDFVLVSRFAAERAWENQRDVVIAKAFGCGTYCNPEAFRLLYRSRAVRRIGVDWRSCEHYWRTVAVFPGSENLFVRTRYLDIPEALKKGELDVGLWDAETVWPFEAEGVLEVETVPASEMDDAMSEACVVVLAGNKLVYDLLARS